MWSRVGCGHMPAWAAVVIQDTRQSTRTPAPSSASVTRPYNLNICLHDGYAGTVNSSCRHGTHPTCLVCLCLRTRGAARVQSTDRYVMLSNDVQGPCIYIRERHRAAEAQQDSSHMSEQCQSLFKYPPHSLLSHLNATLRTALSQSLSLPNKTTLKSRSNLLLLRLPPDSPTSQSTTTSDALRFGRRYISTAEQEPTCAGSPSRQRKERNKDVNLQTLPVSRKSFASIEARADTASQRSKSRCQAV